MALVSLSLFLAACGESESTDSTESTSESLTGELRITFDEAGEGPANALQGVVDTFNAEHPELTITSRTVDREQHRLTIRDQLASDVPDVISWDPGNRMAPLVADSLFEDVSSLWQSEGLLQSMASALPSFTMDSRQWGVPVSYYSWGIYYRRDLFDDLALEEPGNWMEFQAVAETLKANGIVPLTIGTRFLWPAGGVFDYLNLRINGYDVHQELTQGAVSYTDPRIRAVFDTWKSMVDSDYFIEGHEELSWQEAVEPLINGEAGMYLMGNFLVNRLRDSPLGEAQIDVFQFPTITAGVPRAEEAPIDAFFIPSAANNTLAARAFLRFIAQPENQTLWNNSIGQLPVHTNATTQSDKFLQQGFESLSSASALSQFYDRDVPPDMAEAGLRAFQEFMLDTTKLDSILMRLDAVQETVYSSAIE